MIAVLPSSATKASQESSDSEKEAVSEGNTDEVAITTTLREVVDVVSGEDTNSDKKQSVVAVKDDREVAAAKEEEIDTAVGEDETGAAVRDDLDDGDVAESPMPLLGQTRRMVQDLTLCFQALVAQHMAVSNASIVCMQTSCSIIAIHLPVCSFSLTGT